MFKLKFTCIVVFFMTTLYCFGNDELKKLYKLSNDKFYAGDYVGAMSLKMQALTIAEKTNDCYWIAIGNIQVGGVNYYLKNKTLALQQFYTAKLYADSCSLEKIKYLIYQDIGAIYVEEGALDSALKYMNLTAEKLKGTKKYSDLSRTYAIISVLYLGKVKNFKKAEAFIIEAEKYAILSKKESDVMFVEMKKGGYYREKNQYQESLQHYKIAYELALKSNVVEERLSCLSSMAGLLALMGNKESLEYNNKYNALKDSVFNSETANKLASYKVKYETEKKETENILLHQDNLLKQSKIDERNKTIIVLIISILLIIFIIVWRINITSLKNKQQELEATQLVQKEKERISRDLHDNVGGQLSYVLYSLDGMNTDDKHKRTEITSNVNESVRNVISNLRETIWAINDEAISITDFSDKLKVYVRSMFRITDTKISFVENNQSNIQLNSIVGLNLYRICQEIINNAFKHSKATELVINITSKNNVLIEITDNGVGFDLETVKKDGFGLANMKSRASEVGITLELESKLNAGVKYTLLV